MRFLHLEEEIYIIFICTDEEVECSYEEFYEDVHTEFLKFGEIVNFKVCRNGSSHLRGNVYVHYVSLDAAILAYNAINGRYFAGKQVSCEFISVTRWKVAICGEYMKSKLKTCSHGMACNFIHCFRNPAGDYEWADWDKPPPKYWQKKMAALFGYSNESGHEKWIEQDSPGRHGNSSERLSINAVRHHSRRSHSKEVKYSSRSRRDYPEKDESRCYKYRKRDTSHETTRPEVFDEGERNSSSHHGKKRRYDSPSDRDWHDRKHNGRLESHDSRETKRSRSHDTVSDADVSDREIKREKHHEHEYPKKRSRKQKALTGSVDDCDYGKERHYSTGSSRDSSYWKRGSLSSKDHLYQKKRRSHSSDSTEEDSLDRIPESRNERRRKSRKHRNEVSGYQGSGRSLHDKHCEGEGKHGDHNLQAGRKRSSLGKKREHSGRKKSEVDKC